MKSPLDLVDDIFWKMYLIGIILIPVTLGFVLKLITTLEISVIMMIMFVTHFVVVVILGVIFKSYCSHICNHIAHFTTQRYGLLRIDSKVLYNFRDVTSLDFNKLEGNFYSLMGQGTPGKVIIGFIGDIAIVINSKNVYDDYELSFTKFYLAPNTILDFSIRFLPEEMEEILNKDNIFEPNLI